jgi:DNA-binding CsgD family transcriptional regulator
VLRLFRQHVRPRADYGLTAREREVLGLLVEDHTQKEIAEKLFVSPHTVDTHLRNIYRKLGVRSRSGAIVKALRERLL